MEKFYMYYYIQLLELYKLCIECLIFCKKLKKIIVLLKIIYYIEKFIIPKLLFISVIMFILFVPFSIKFWVKLPEFYKIFTLPMIIFNFGWSLGVIVKNLKLQLFMFSSPQLFPDWDEIELHYQMQRERILKSTPNRILAKFKIMRLFIWEIGILTLLWQPIAKTEAWRIIHPLWISLNKNLETSFPFLTRR